jgi:tetratricopeptide (TPR) repeat protein
MPDGAAPQTPPDVDSLWNYADPAATETVFRDTLARAGGEAAPVAWRLELLTQLARTQSLQRKWDACHAILDQVEPHLSDDGHMPRVRVRLALERGRAFNDVGRFDEAKRQFAGAWELAKANRIDGLAVDAAHMLGIMDPPEEAIAWNERALAYAESSDEPKAKRWYGTLNNNLGWAYHRVHRYADALRLFRDLVDHFADHGLTAREQVARYSVAKTLRLMGDAVPALATQLDLIRAAEDAGQPDGYFMEEAAECLLALGRNDEARPYFARAHEILSKDPWFPPGEAARLERMWELGGDKTDSAPAHDSDPCPRRGSDVAT